MVDDDDRYTYGTPRYGSEKEMEGRNFTVASVTGIVAVLSFSLIVVQ